MNKKLKKEKKNWKKKIWKSKIYLQKFKNLRLKNKKKLIYCKKDLKSNKKKMNPLLTRNLVLFMS